MISHEGIDRNFRFLVVEVRRQVETVFKLLANPSDTLIRSVLSRDNYTDTLKSLIAKKCISFYRHAVTIDEQSANRVTAINVATTNLERIADFCGNIAVRVRRLRDRAFLDQFDFAPYSAVLADAILLVEEAMRTLNTTVALRVCRAEESLDQLYNADFNRIREALQTGEDVDDLLSCLYIFHYLERMGDSLLNIGEAILFAATGEKLKLHEYLRLRDALSARDPSLGMSDYAFDFDLETRSGCRIGLVHEKTDAAGSEADAIFKKGHADKIRKERANIARWEELEPGLPPRVLEFRDGDADAALLLEFLDGYTLRDLVLNAERPNVDRAIEHLQTTLRHVWRATRRDEPVNAGFMRQTLSRLEDVFRLHPRFRSPSREIGTVAIASLADLIKSAAEIEETLSAPFTVLVHGDLNGDNVIYNHREDRIHLIDLYRTHESDWLQDITVLLVSNFRLPVPSGGAIREALNHAILRIYDFARDFAADQQDRTYGARLALGLARSLITSTRFEIDETFAGEMYDRAVYLLEKIVSLPPEKIDAFQPSSEVLIY